MSKSVKLVLLIVFFALLAMSCHGFQPEGQAREQSFRQKHCPLQVTWQLGGAYPSVKISDFQSGEMASFSPKKMKAQCARVLEVFHQKLDMLKTHQQASMMNKWLAAVRHGEYLLR